MFLSLRLETARQVHASAFKLRRRPHIGWPGGRPAHSTALLAGATGGAMCRLPFQILCICATCLTVIGCATGTQKQSAQTQKVASEPTTLGLNCVQRVSENP